MIISNEQLFTKFSDTGECEINRDEIRSFVGCKIVQHGANFRLHHLDMAVTLSPLDALWLIDQLSLGAHKSEIMRRVVTWKD
jgi:hypothetical protein